MWCLVNWSLVSGSCIPHALWLEGNGLGTRLKKWHELIYTITCSAAWDRVPICAFEKLMVGADKPPLPGPLLSHKDICMTFLAHHQVWYWNKCTHICLFHIQYSPGVVEYSCWIRERTEFCQLNCRIFHFVSRASILRSQSCLTSSMSWWVVYTVWLCAPPTIHIYISVYQVT